MKNIALFPGSFDPMTYGHVDIAQRVLPFFDKLYIGIGVNATKQHMFPLSKRKDWIERIFRKEEKIEVATFEGLTVHFCNEIGARCIIRGIRSVKDFEYEKAIADMNGQLEKDIQTFFLASSPQYSTLGSTLVRDVIRNGGEVSDFVPELILRDLRETKNKWT